MKRLNFGFLIFSLWGALLFNAGLLKAQKQKDISKSIRISNYSTYISDNTIKSKGLSNTLELFNYYFTNSTAISSLTLGTESKYLTGQNSFSYFFKKNIRLNNSLVWVKGTSLVNEIFTVYWDPMRKMWTPVPVNSKFLPKDTLITSSIADNFFVSGLGLRTYKNLINFGTEFFYMNKTGDRPDNNIQISVIAEILKQRKFGAFLHADYIQNQQYSKFNKDYLYFTEGEITAKIRPFTLSINGGYGKSVFRYALLDNGYLEYNPLLLKYTYGCKALITFPSWGGIFFSVSQTAYHPPNDKLIYTSYYGGIKITLKKY